jgi:two-component system OmpR family sensor kinase
VATLSPKRRLLGLRLRLTLSYVIIFTVLLVVVGALFHRTLETSLYDNTSAILDEEWATVRGYLLVEKGRPVWKYDRDDTEEAFIVQRLRRIFLFTDASGNVLEVSDAYSYLGIESKDELKAMVKAGKPIWRVRQDPDGVSYLIRSAVLNDGGSRFLVSMGRALDANERILRQFTKRYFAIVPLLILASSLLGWLMAGRALRPLNDVAQAAQSITGDNLSLRIQRRGAEDELDHLIDTFNGMVDRLQASFNQVRQFSTDVSHELRTPLTAIRGELEVAMFSAETVEQYREAMVNAIESVERLSQVVRALLQLSQAESGQLVLMRERLDLAAIVLQVVDQYEIPAEMDGIRLKSKLSAKGFVSGDRIQLERLVSNLLTNAIKYTGQGGLVEVTVRSKGDRVELIVQDTGRGIAPEHIPRIFERFYRVPEGVVDPDRGLGLGLSFVAWIAKAHGAQIQVHSTPGEGTRFELSFPAAAPPRPSPEDPPQEKGAMTRSRKIESSR